MSFYEDNYEFEYIREKRNPIVTKDEIYTIIDCLPNYRDKYVILGLFELGASNDYEILKNLKHKPELFTAVP